MPVQEEKSYKPLNPADVETSTARGTGPGGQHRNMTDSAVRMVHKPTKIQVVLDGRSQHDNRREAMRILTARVRDQEQAKKDKAYSDKRREQMKGGNRSDKLRTYNLIDNWVKDHRTGKETKDVKKIMRRGRLDLVL